MTVARPAEPLAADMAGAGTGGATVAGAGTGGATVAGAGTGGATMAGAGDLARASLAVARRYAAGGTMWCCSPSWSFHAHHVAVEFVHPVIVGKRALSAVAVPSGADLVATLRASVLPGDIVCALAGSDDEAVAAAMRRGEAWGVETVWIGAGERPAAGAADHVLWLDTDDALLASERFVRIYHMLWELTHVCFEHPGLLRAQGPSRPSGRGAEPEDCDDEVCITCSDQAVLAEIVTVTGDEALVVAAGRREQIDVSCIDSPAPGDLVLVHAGTAIATPRNGSA